MSHPASSIDIPSVSMPSAWSAGWTVDPLVIGGLVASVALYTIGAVRLWQRAGVAHGVRPHQALAHAAGILVLAVALLSPLDGASDALFSAHMAQHELLMLVAAPLLVLGRPVVPAVWALPRDLRVRAMGASRTPAVRRAWYLATSPVVALGLHAAVRWLWHVPSAFDAALGDEVVHGVQHVTFFATAMLFWWTLIHGRYGRFGYGVGVAFVFVTLLHSGLLAAIVSFAESPIYAHGERTARLGLDALADQQQAGLVMWVPAGILMMSIGLAILAAWLGQSARRMAQSAHPSLR